MIDTNLMTVELKNIEQEVEHGVEKTFFTTDGWFSVKEDEDLDPDELIGIFFDVLDKVFEKIIPGDTDVEKVKKVVNQNRKNFLELLRTFPRGIEHKNFNNKLKIIKTRLIMLAVFIQKFNEIDDFSDSSVLNDLFYLFKHTINSFHNIVDPGLTEYLVCYLYEKKPENHFHKLFSIPTSSFIFRPKDFFGNFASYILNLTNPDKVDLEKETYIDDFGYTRELRDLFQKAIDHGRAEKGLPPGIRVDYIPDSCYKSLTAVQQLIFFYNAGLSSASESIAQSIILEKFTGFDFHCYESLEQIALEVSIKIAANPKEYIHLNFRPYHLYTLKVSKTIQDQLYDALLLLNEFFKISEPPTQIQDLDMLDDCEDADMLIEILHLSAFQKFKVDGVYRSDTIEKLSRNQSFYNLLSKFFKGKTRIEVFLIFFAALQNLDFFNLLEEYASVSSLENEKFLLEFLEKFSKLDSIDMATKSINSCICTKDLHYNPTQCESFIKEFIDDVESFDLQTVLQQPTLVSDEEPEDEDGKENHNEEFQTPPENPKHEDDAEDPSVGSKPPVGNYKDDKEGHPEKSQPPPSEKESEDEDGEEEDCHEKSPQLPAEEPPKNETKKSLHQVAESSQNNPGPEVSDDPVPIPVPNIEPESQSKSDIPWFIVGLSVASGSSIFFVLAFTIPGVFLVFLPIGIIASVLGGSMAIVGVVRKNKDSETLLKERETGHTSSDERTGNALADVDEMKVTENFVNNDIPVKKQTSPQIYKKQ